MQDVCRTGTGVKFGDQIFQMILWWVYGALPPMCLPSVNLTSLHVSISSPPYFILEVIE